MGKQYWDHTPPLPLFTPERQPVCLLVAKQTTNPRKTGRHKKQPSMSQQIAKKKTRKEKSSAAKEHALETETAEPAQMNIFLQNISQINIFLQNISLFTK